MTARPFDPEVALRRMRGSKATLRSIVSLFLAECPKLLERIRQAIAAGAADELSLAAHTLKGSADILAGEPVVRAALALEQHGRAGDLAAAATALPELERAVAAMTAALATWSE